MKRCLRSLSLGPFALLVSLLVTTNFASAATHYVVTNDDSVPPFQSGVTFYTVARNGLLTLQQQVVTGGFGIGGGFFGANRIRALNSGGQNCVYASQANDGNIVGIDVNTLAVGGTAAGSASDAGTSNGIGLALNDQYLYASFTDSNTIGAFQLQSGCSLSFIGDVSVAGVKGGIVNGMAAHGNMLIATYTDGSIESFDISAGVPTSHGDRQLSTATVGSHDATFPNSVDITQDGHYALLGDTSTAVVVEVSDISSGKLAPTVVYKSLASISSSNIMLSPDESVLYVVNTQGDRVSAAFFDKNSGKLSPGCTSGLIRGLSENWSYLAGMALASTTGNGGGVYIAEFGSGIAMVKLSVSGRSCSLQEAPQSPAEDPNTPGLLSIGSFPPRSF